MAGDDWQAFLLELNSFLAALPAGAVKKQDWQRETPAKGEGLAIPAQVNYVGKGANLFTLGYEPHGSAAVINNYMGTTYLWEKVRVQGGAYGGFSVFDHDSGIFTFLSYRDPNLGQTLDNYDRTAEFLDNLELSGDELKKSIIGTIGEMDTYLLPDAKGFTSMARWLTKNTDQERQRTREEVLGTTARDFKAFAQVLKRLAEQGEVVVLGSQQAIEKTNEERGGLLEVKKVL